MRNVVIDAALQQMWMSRFQCGGLLVHYARQWAEQKTDDKQHGRKISIRYGMILTPRWRLRTHSP